MRWLSFAGLTQDPRDPNQYQDFEKVKSGQEHGTRPQSLAIACIASSCLGRGSSGHPCLWSPEIVTEFDLHYIIWPYILEIERS